VITLAGFNLSEAARLLRIPRSTLQHYTAKYGVEISTLKRDFAAKS